MSDTSIEALEAAAVAYLRQQLGDRAPQELRLEGQFDERPLDGEGPTALFSFDLDPAADGGGANAATTKSRHYVAVGQTEPNFLPAYGLDPDDAYSLHIGTRFMLEMQVQVVDAAYEPPGAREAMEVFAQAYGGGGRPENAELATLFRCEETYFAVYRLTIGGEDVFCMGAGCPPGFYRMTQHPPQVALRVHLGKLIRAEKKREVADE